MWSRCGRYTTPLRYVRPETLAGELGASEIRIVRRDDVPEKRADDTDWARARAGVA